MRKIAFLSLFCLLCLGSAADAWISFFCSHNNYAPMEGLKTIPSKGKFWLISLEGNWHESVSPVTGDKSGPAPDKGEMTINAKDSFALEGGKVSKAYSQGVVSLDIRPESKSGEQTTFYPIMLNSATPRGYEFASFVGNAETALKGSVVSADIGGIHSHITLPVYKTTAEQLADKAVPYIELIADEKGFITGAKARMVDPTDTSKALTNVPNFNNWGSVRIRFSADGAKIYREVTFETKDADNLLSRTFTLPKGMEGVIRADRVERTRTGYYNEKDKDSFRIRWDFLNEANINTFADPLNPSGETKAPDKTEITMVSVDVYVLGYSIPSSGLEVKKAGSGTTAVNEAMSSELAKDTVNLVKAAVFEVSYPGEQDGNKVLPTTMKFSATSTDVGSKVWEIISDDTSFENVLKHVRVFKIVPVQKQNGAKVVDLVKEVPTADWEKVFSANVDLANEKVDITANIMIRDATDNDASGKFEGVKTFNAMSYLMYMDGEIDGLFKDPIALVSYEAEPEPKPDPKPSGASSGCNTAYLPFVLLFAIPLMRRK